jgi:hypothetical protein
MMKEEWWQTQNQKNCNNGEDENEGISIQNIGGVFILVLAGTVLASIMLAFEYYWYKRRVPKKGTEAPKQVMEMASSAANRHGDNYNANYNTDYNTCFHNNFFDQKNEELNKDKVRERRESNLPKDNHGFELDEDKEHRLASHKEE